MLTDPIADMLSRIRNANRAMHDTVSMPTSRMKEEIARLLHDEGYIKGFSVAEAEPVEPARDRAQVRAQPRAGDHWT